MALNKIETVMPPCDTDKLKASLAEALAEQHGGPIPAAVRPPEPSVQPAPTPTPPPPVSKPAIKLTEKQELARTKFFDWFRENQKQPKIFRVFGYAGTGKSTVTKQIVQRVQDEFDVDTFYGAYTGKATLVMEKNGMPASTIHSTIYKVIEPDRAHVTELHKKVKNATNEDERKALKKAVEEAESLSFELNEESPLRNAGLYVLDECSMVNQEMLDDILTFKVPLLVLGDPGQLPPVEGTGALINEKPNVFLDEIMRQALDNPIIKLSILARGGAAIPRQDWGKAKHISKKFLTDTSLVEFDQILAGKNTTRMELNKRLRAIKGYSGRYPVPGDRLICLRNNKKLGTFNGLMCTVLKVLDEYPTTIQYELQDELGKKFSCKILRAFFDEYYTPGTVKEMKWWDFKDGESFDFGYAITVHKSQGSQWDNVLLWDDNFFVWDKPQRARWLYTGVTRAADRFTLAS